MKADIDALRVIGGKGRPVQMNGRQLEALRRSLLDRPTSHGFGTELWTLKRIRLLIERLFGVSYSEVHVWRIISALGFSNQKPDRRAIERDDAAVGQFKCKTWPALKKAKRESRIIVFVDESGLSERPTRVCTWVPKGQTPIIQFHFNWKHLSVIAGLTLLSCLFRFHEGSIKREEIVEFLKALKAHLKQPLLIIWDGLKAHRSKLVSSLPEAKDYLRNGMTMKMLDAIAAECSDNDSAQRLNEARAKLFQSINKTQQRVA